MSLNTQPYKGARDFYPEQKRDQKYMFGVLRQVVESFGYHEYDAPIIEPLDIYLAKSGEEIINEQIYSFEDRGGRKVAIRPEMTPTVSRMVAAKRQELSYPLRWYSIPNLWRYERPQRGRLREHWQLNVDIFGVAGVEADHEIILIADSIFKAFGAKAGSYEIRVNSRELINSFLKEHLHLDAPQMHDTLKLVDRIHKMPREDFVKLAREIIKDNNHVAQLMEFLNSSSVKALPSSISTHQSVARLTELFDLLGASGVSGAVFDPSVVRGLDYYSDIVFEVFDTNPENNRAMFGGGRYDGLVELFGVEHLPTVGFGMGDVTLMNFLETHKLLPRLKPEADITAILVGDVYAKAQKALQELRSKGVNIAVDPGGRKLDAQIKSAVKSGVRFAVFIGEQELKINKFKLKDLQKGEEKELGIDELARTLAVHRDS